MTKEISLDKKKWGRLPHLPHTHDHYLNFWGMPEIILDLQWPHCFFEPCILHEYAWLFVQFLEGKKEGKNFCDCFHLNFLVVGESFDSPFVSLGMKLYHFTADLDSTDIFGIENEATKTIAFEVASLFDCILGNSKWARVDWLFRISRRSDLLFGFD